MTGVKTVEIKSNTPNGKKQVHPDAASGEVSVITCPIITKKYNDKLQATTGT